MNIVSLMRSGFAATCLFCGLAFAQEEQNKYWTGDGGNKIRLAVLEPEGKGISDNDLWMLSLIQSSIIGDFNKFSDIKVIDRQNIEKIMSEQKEAMSARYSDENRIRIGNLTNASHILIGTVTKTPNAFMLEFSVTDLQSGERKASYSPKPVSAASLENLSAIKEATADLLSRLGVNLTGTAIAELKQAANIARIQAEGALAKGIVAKRAGTDVAALSYFYQAAELDPSLLEAANRSSVMAVNISSGNVGADTRNKILWRRDWIARLTETEKLFDNLFNTNSLPYTLFYATKIIEGDINYHAETQTLSINTNLRASIETRIWLSSIEKSLQAVYDGLDATNMKGEWGLQNWPWTSVTALKSFEGKSKTFSIAAELVNSRGAVIGKAKFQSNGSWRFNGSGRPEIYISGDDGKQVNFANVRADDITDNITIRIASVNGIDANTVAKSGVLQIKAASESEFYSSVSFEIKNGEIVEYNGKGGNVVIPDAVWGEPVMSVKAKVFWNKGITNVTIPNSVTYIGDSAFANNKLTGVTIGANVYIGQNAFPGDFGNYYNYARYVQGVLLKPERRAGTYTYYSGHTIDGKLYEGWNRPAETIVEQKDREELINKIIAEKIEQRIKNKEWATSLSTAVGTPIMINSVDTLYKSAGFLFSGNSEFYRADIDFFRIGLNFTFGGVPRRWDVIKKEYPGYVFVETIKEDTTEIKGYMGMPITNIGGFIRLYPAKGWFLQGGAGFGAYGGYRASMVKENDKSWNPDTTEVRVHETYAAVFPISTGFVFAPRSLVSPFFEAQYNIVPLSDRTAWYLSASFGVKFWHLRREIYKW